MNLSNEQIKILPKLISKGIKKSKVLPRQPYIKEELEKKGFKNLPKKDPFFFIDEVSVNIAGNFQKGCLLVHLDGLYSNCVPDSPDDELKLIMPWDSIYDILVNDSKTARAMPDGLTELLLLTDDNKNPEEAQCLSIIMKSPSKLNSPFSVIKSIYDNIWKRMIDLYRGKPIIWGSHIDWFTQETFFSRDEFVGFYLEKLKKKAPKAEPKAKEEACIKGLTTPLAEISYLLLSFAYFTDGKHSEEEHEEAMKNVLDLAEEWNCTPEEATEAWGQALKVYDECETTKDIFLVFVGLLNILGSRESFTNREKKALVVQLESIMNADHVQHENEIMWVNKIKEIWKLEEDSSQDSSDEEKSEEKKVLEKAMEGITKKDLAEKIVKNIEVSTKNPEAYAFVKSVSSKNADCTKIEEQLEDGMDKFIDFADEDGYTALHYACWDNKVDIVELLMDNGANVNALSSMKESPLHMAVFSGHVSVVDLFIEHSALVLARPSKGDDVDFTLRHQTPSPVLPKNGSNITRDAVLNGHWDIFDLLVKHISPDLSIFEEPCVIGIDGETNFFAAIEIFYKNNNIDYNKERLDVLRSVVESSPDTSGNKKKTTKKKSEVKVSEGDSKLARPLKQFGFLLCSFAKTMDNKFSKEEMAKVHEIIDDEKIAVEIFDWFNEEMGKVNWKFDDKAFQKVLLDCIHDVGNFLNQFDDKAATYYDKYSAYRKKLYINDLISVAHADGKILDREIAFIEMLCEVINIEIPDIKDDNKETRWGQATVEEEKENKEEMNMIKESVDLDNATQRRKQEQNKTDEPKESKHESSTAQHIDPAPNEETPIWEIIQYEFINLGKESVVKKEFSNMILSRYPHIKKGTLGAQISIQVINKRSRTNYNQCGKERVCGDNKFDFLFEQEDKTLCKYDKSKHGIWEIYKRDDGKLDVRIVKN